MTNRKLITASIYFWSAMIVLNALLILLVLADRVKPDQSEIVIVEFVFAIMSVIVAMPTKGGER